MQLSFKEINSARHWVQPVQLLPALLVYPMIRVPAAQSPIQLPADVPGKSGKDSPSAWGAFHMESWMEFQDSGFGPSALVVTWGGKPTEERSLVFEISPLKKVFKKV